ncbi:hypothetical protein VKT23_008491 [Stygiomarasmius scandens]|uniref:Cyclin n=1 Tax=Marasmiellus scandens TaxID=2682957 RepID=A0ABR1JH76_9AGAR
MPVPLPTTLPSIAHLDRHLHILPPSESALPEQSPFPNHFPVTPPDDAPPPHYEMDVDPKHQLFVDTHLTAVDWIDFSRTRSAHFIAEKTCEMICYLWFQSSSPSSSHSPPPSTNSPLFNRPTPPSTLQFVATPNFVSFMQKLLETTQVSQSVIVLSLHYIYRLKERNRFTPAQAGSEFRIAVAGLMMANKFLDDNTYTNKTWSEVSGIGLEEINRMEREFLMGVDCNLYVDKATYQSWLHLLKGLVMAKERDSRHFRKTRPAARGARHPTTHTPARYPAGRARTHRARSTSPESSRRLPFPQVPPSYSFTSYPLSQTQITQPPQYSDRDQQSYNSLPPSPRPAGSKRSAAAAFSPTSAAFANIPSKRPVGISLQIPETSTHGISSNGSSGSSTGPSSYSPLEGLNSFARMSIDVDERQQPQAEPTASKKSMVPETLVAGYALDPERRTSVPRNLYFYTLACSPLEFATASYGSNTPAPAEPQTPSDVEEPDADNERYDRIRRGARKARLRYHQPPQPGEYNPYSYGPHVHAQVPPSYSYGGTAPTAAPYQFSSSSSSSSSTYSQPHVASPATVVVPSSTLPTPASASTSTSSSTPYGYPALRNAMGAPTATPCSSSHAPTHSHTHTHGPVYGYPIPGGYVQSASTSPNDVHISVVPPTAAAFHEQQAQYAALTRAQAQAQAQAQVERDDEMQSDEEDEEEEEEEEEDEVDELQDDDDEGQEGDDEMDGDEEQVDEEVEKPRLPHFQDIASWDRAGEQHRYVQQQQHQQVVVPSQGHAQLHPPTEPPRYSHAHYHHSQPQPQPTHISTSPVQQRTPVHMTHQLHTPHQPTPAQLSAQIGRRPSQQYPPPSLATPDGSPVKSAPFANAGPPGIHCYNGGSPSSSYGVSAPAPLSRAVSGVYTGSGSGSGYVVPSTVAASTTYPTPVQSYYEHVPSSVHHHHHHHHQAHQQHQHVQQPQPSHQSHHQSHHHHHQQDLWMKRPSVAM